MQFYLLLALSGVISGSTVLAQVATGYAAAGCSGATTFTYTVTATPTCTDTTASDTKSVDLPAGARCALYESSGCAGTPELLDTPGCAAVELPSVGSFACVLDEAGNGASGDDSGDDSGAGGF